MKDAKIRRTYIAAFEGAKTADGGEILHGSGIFATEGRTLVRVGDIATYPDGSTAVILAGAGKAMEIAGCPPPSSAAPEQRRPHCIQSCHSTRTPRARGRPHPGLLDPTYRPAHG